MLVGGNGAGKSTFYRLALDPLGLPFVNADLLARIAFPDDPEAHSYEAAMLAEGLRHQLHRCVVGSAAAPRLLPQDRPACLEEVRRFALHAGRGEQDLAGEQAMGGSSSGSQPREGGIGRGGLSSGCRDALAGGTPRRHPPLAAPIGETTSRTEP